MANKARTPDPQPQAETQPTGSNAELAAKMRQAADQVEKQPQAQAAVGDGSLIRRLLEVLLAALLDQNQPPAEATKTK